MIERKIVYVVPDDLSRALADINEGRDVEWEAGCGSIVVLRNPLMANPREGVTFTREQLEGWAGRPLSDDDVTRLEAAVLNSSIPEAIETIVSEALGLGEEGGE